MSDETKDKILQMIEEKKIAMKPRWHFVLQTALAITGVVGLLLALLFVMSFVVFTMGNNGLTHVPLDLAVGWLMIARNTPWMLIVVALIFIVLLEILVRQYAFSYKRPLIYTATAIVLVSALGSFLLVKTPLHGALQERARVHQLPLGEKLYHHYPMKKIEGIKRGMIQEFTERGFLLREGNERAVIILTPKTRAPHDLQEQEYVVVVGSVGMTDEFVAVKVKRLPR